MKAEPSPTSRHEVCSISFTSLRVRNTPGPFSPLMFLQIHVSPCSLLLGLLNGGSSSKHISVKRKGWKFWTFIRVTWLFWSEKKPQTPTLLHSDFSYLLGICYAWGKLFISLLPFICSNYNNFMYCFLFKEKRYWQCLGSLQQEYPIIPF